MQSQLVRTIIPEGGYDSLGKITNIEYDNDNKYSRISISLENSPTSKAKYEMRISNKQLCCEYFGIKYIRYGDGEEELELSDIMDLDISNVRNFYTGNNVESIKIEYGKGQFNCDNNFVSVTFTLVNTYENTKSFKIVLFNNHNGYYPHDVEVLLYENDDVESMNIYSSWVSFYQLTQKFVNSFLSAVSKRINQIFS
jgi:hypothetical protein